VENICGAGGSGVAIYVHDKGECWVLCQSSAPVVPANSRPRLSLQASVSIKATEVDRARLADFLAQLCEAKLFIPAGAASEKVDLFIEHTTLGDAIERAGLLSERDRP
jgi:hypothetical protein